MNGLKATLGIIVGTLTGLSIGILFAPNKGTRTRKRITRNGIRLAEDLGDKLLDLNDEVRMKVRSARKDTADLAKKGSELVEEVTN
jgi:gas vesicle protein